MKIKLKLMSLSSHLSKYLRVIIIFKAKRDPAGYPSDSPPGPFFRQLMRSTLISGWCVPAAATRSGSCGRSPPSYPAHRCG